VSTDDAPVAERRPEALEATNTLFSTRPGAVGIPPQHYGNPLGEQRALAAGAAIVDLSDRAVITVTGPDRLTWLDSLTSQALTKLQPGDSAETLLLDPTGRLEHAIRVIDDGVTTWLLVDGPEGAPLAAWLDRMRFMLRVEIADRSVDFATVGTLALLASRASASAGPVAEALEANPTSAAPVAEALEANPTSAAPVAEALEANPTSAAPVAEALEAAAARPNSIPLIWRDPWTDVTAGGHQYARAAEHPAAGWTYAEVLVDRADAAAVASLAELPAAGTLALDALRIAAWRPKLATEGDEKSIPHELDWLRSAVHLNKGCYRGQETVAKVHNLGHPPRRLVMLHLDGSDGVLPQPGDALLAPVASSASANADPVASSASANADPVAEALEAPDAEPRPVGRITSAALHYELGPIALAVIKRTVDPALELIVVSDGAAIAAAQEVIVPVDAGAEANVPRIPRLGAVKRPARSAPEALEGPPAAPTPAP